jgi:hypothetical protein
MSRLFSSGFELQSVTSLVEFDSVSGAPTINTSIKRSGAAITRYLCCGETHGEINASETPTQVTWRTAGTVSNLYSRLPIIPLGQVKNLLYPVAKLLIYLIITMLTTGSVAGYISKRYESSFNNSNQL